MYETTCEFFSAIILLIKFHWYGHMRSMHGRRLPQKLLVYIPPRPLLISFLLPSKRAVRSYRHHLEESDPFETMTGHTVPSSDGLLAEVFFGAFLSCNANLRRSVHNPQDHFVITLINSDRRD